MHMSICVKLVGMTKDGVSKFFRKFTPPPCDSRKEYASRILNTLSGFDSHNIFLNIAGVKKMRFLSSATSRIIL
jgi:hypothetical protein